MSNNVETAEKIDAGQPGAAVIVAPRPPAHGIVGAVLTGFLSLLKGMKVTIHYFLRPSTVVTQQYPENRKTLKMAERFRGQLAFDNDENGQHKCIACHSCETACPNFSIRVVDRKGPTTGKNEINYFVWRFDSCTFCNMCVLVCPTAALKMLPSFESAVYDQKLLVYNLNPYAGPAATALAKIADPEERKKLMEPRKFYEGPLPLCGEQIPGCPAGRKTHAAQPAKGEAAAQGAPGDKTC